ncbi:MAG TPA: nucleotidyltransferase family protein [Nitriliruptorales bacterium]|nr:nucleotidyltransferase family protein [Nitriliruptorales bacterium]
MTADASAFATEVAAVGLAGGSSVLRRPAGTWDAAVELLARERLTGLAVEAVLEGRLELSASQADELLAAHQQAMARALDHERVLVAVGGALQDAGVGVAVLKGPAFAHCFYRDPAARPFADLDLMVAADDWRRSCTLLEDLGYRRLQPEPRAGFDERFGKAATHRDAAGRTVDLHRTLVVGPFGLWIRPEELLARLQAFELGGRRFLRLDDTGSLLNACVHASLGWWPPSLLAVRDVAQIALNADVDWGRFAAWTERWRLGVVVADAFRTVERLLRLPVPPPVHRLVTAGRPPRERRLLSAYQGQTRAHSGPALATLAAIPGVAAKAGYLRALLLPDRRFLAARAPGQPSSYLRRWAIPARWLTRSRRPGT